MLTELIELCYENGVSTIIADRALEGNLESNNIEFVSDVRSGLFYAYGKAKLINPQMIVYIVSEANLPNAYTGLTEAWFQNANMMMIVVNNEANSINNDYMDVCINYKLNMSCMDSIININEFISAIKKPGIKLINIVEKIASQEHDYKEILSQISEIDISDENIFIYNSSQIFNRNINNISTQHKYGVISKFMGYVVGRKQLSLLCCPASILELDINTFNMRYINSNMKMVFYNYISELKDKNIVDWIKNNGINCTEINSIDELNQVICTYDVVFIREDINVH